MNENMNTIKAFRLNPYGKINKGLPARNWMDTTDHKFAYGCIPLVMANTLGWDILLQTNFVAYWNGGSTKEDIKLFFENENDPNNEQVQTHFGHGILTFHPGFLFKTNENINLMVKGAPNFIKDGIQPLEGVVETDWLPFTFTMNWKFTRPGTYVEFNKEEPIARIIPYKRGFIESFIPSIHHLSEDEKVAQDLQKWSDDRAKHNKKLADNLGNFDVEKLQEKHYLKGINKTADNSIIADHQKRLTLNDFINEK